MDATVAALTAFLVVAGAIALVGGVAIQFLPGLRRDRLVAPTAAARGDSILRWAAPDVWWQRVVEAVGRRTAPQEPQNVSKLRRRLGWGGYHSPNAVVIFTGARFVLALLLGAVYPLAGVAVGRSLPNPLAVTIFLAYAGFWLPAFVLRRTIKSRQEKIARALPDFLDLLTVCVEAGMSFDAALARVANQPDARTSPLHQEILRMNLEVSAGRPRPEALRALGIRCGVEEVTTLVSVFVQTERLGTSLGRALRIHADTARVQRRHRLEAMAYTAPLKMIGPTVIFLMPAFILVAMGPSLIGLFAILRSIGHK